MTWHFFGDQGTAQLEGRQQAIASNRVLKRPTKSEEGLEAQAFVSLLYGLVGRPFKVKKHLQAAPVQDHLGLTNDLRDSWKGRACSPPEGRQG